MQRALFAVEKGLRRERVGLAAGESAEQERRIAARGIPDQNGVLCLPQRPQVLGDEIDARTDPCDAFVIPGPPYVSIEALVDADSGQRVEELEHRNALHAPAQAAEGDDQPRSGSLKVADEADGRVFDELCEVLVHSPRLRTAQATGGADELLSVEAVTGAGQEKTRR